MKAVQDISPWQEVQLMSIKSNHHENNIVLPKVAQLVPASFSGDALEQFQDKNGSEMMGSIRQSLQYMKNKSTQENFYSQLTRTNHKVIVERNGQNQFKPSNSVFSFKKLNPPPMTIKRKPPSKSQSTPFIKSRMQNLLKNYQIGHSNEKYSKQQGGRIQAMGLQQQGSKGKLQKIQAKRNNIEFLYNSAARQRMNPEQRPKRQRKGHVLDYLLGRWS